MKTRHYLFIGTLGLALTGIIFTGCKKDTPAPTVPSTQTSTEAAQDDANASFVMNDSKNISDGANQGQADERVMNGYPILLKRDTIVNSVHDTLLDVYFGPTDMLCSDFRTRRGHVIIYFVPNTYLTLGSVIGMTFYNYYVNDIGVTGARTLTNTSSTSWNLQANLTLTYPNNGGYATWNSTREDTLKQVGSIWYWTVSGSASGQCRTGATYTITITQPLYVEVSSWISTNPWPSCPDIESGKLTLTAPGYVYPLYVTFGTAIGTCSNTGVASIDNINYNFYQQ